MFFRPIIVRKIVEEKSRSVLRARFYGLACPVISFHLLNRTSWLLIGCAVCLMLFAYMLDSSPIERNNAEARNLKEEYFRREEQGVIISNA